MVAALGVSQKQRAVIEFLCCENEPVANIHKKLKMLYGDDAVDRNKVSRWANNKFGSYERAQVSSISTIRPRK